MKKQPMCKGEIRCLVSAKITQQVGGLPGGSVARNLPSNTGDPGSIPGLGRFPWRRKWQSVSVFSPGKSHGQRSLAGYSPGGHKRVGHDLATKQQRQPSKSGLEPWEILKVIEGTVKMSMKRCLRQMGTRCC